MNNYLRARPASANVTEFTNVSMESEEMYGPFNSIFCISRDGSYKVMGKKHENHVFLFEPPAVKYYADWETDRVEGDIKNGLRIDKNPIYILVNNSPEDGEKPRIEIDFS